ncbi:molybdopterin molybdotransferase [Filomicrobium insigne]|uniref:Molybdopterin molybdenumtransferase n=1 Tax=Filomicrobium insigne TaxID=418854 RepID=A0A1H0R8S2_9HYPH|nr:gephyrin-like molybdotransferase Glp [Filomicrobium insigne]SDP25348.1 molybdopterin molybdotransferase [Filomicrobium insigne]
MAPLSVPEALARILDGVRATEMEEVDLFGGRGRILASTLTAQFSQPPFDASAMDGYAVRDADVATLPARLTVIGEAAAGHPFAGTVAEGQAVRIFTGAPVPEGADAIVIQENTDREGDVVVVREGKPDPAHVRKRGGDFTKGDELLPAGLKLAPRHLSLAAAMGYGKLPVMRRPVVAILATGDELVEPGTPVAAGQIVCSNPYGIAAMAEAVGAEARLIGIARDTVDSLTEKIATAEGADILVTIGGASVGDHDLVAKVLQANGMTLDFWKIAMRPGKPLIFGHRGAQRVIGVPGNPVSSLICTRVFVVPLIRKLLGLDTGTDALMTARLTHAIEKNGPRQHYMRARLMTGENGVMEVRAAGSQDSSLLEPLSAANCLIVRPADAEALPEGASVNVLRIDF